MTTPKHLAAVAVAVLALAAPASATIIIEQGSAPPLATYIAFIPPQTGPSIQGRTAEPGTGTSFSYTTSTAGEILTGRDNVVFSTDGFLENLSFGPTDPNIGVTGVFFPVNTNPPMALTISAVDQFGRTFSTTFATDGIFNFFRALASDGELIRNVTISAPPQGPGARLSLGSTGVTGITVVQAAIPEPATWATMLFGFGAVGYALRRAREPHRHRTRA